MKLDSSFVLKVIPEAVVRNKMDFFWSGATHDSRNVRPGMAFFAIKGAQSDGHLFIQDAIARGASVVFVDYAKRSLLETLDCANVAVVLVPLAEQALYDLAYAWRQQFVIPVIGITGTVGKTTTKELLAHVLRTVGQVCHLSPGNMNTRIGLSCALFDLNSAHMVLVCEMGISCPGEMRELADLVRPTLGVITTIGHQHMDGMASLRTIAHEKKQIFSSFTPEHIGFINGDVPLLTNATYGHPVVRFGFKRSNQVHARHVRYIGGVLSAKLCVFDQEQSVALPVPHRGYLAAVLAVAAVAYILEIPLEQVCVAVESFQPVDGRFLAKKSATGSCLVINDAYNANPESMREALVALDKIPGYSHKIAILGDMLGLGEQSVFWHRQVGRMLRNTKSISQVVFVGSQIAQAVKTMPHVIGCTQVNSWEEVYATLPKNIGNSAILLKASRGVGLSNLAPILGKL